jgi:hypothetical protein
MAGNNQSLAACEGCSLNRSGRQRYNLGCSLMITHCRSAGVALERTTAVSCDEAAAGPASRLFSISILFSPDRRLQRTFIIELM